MKTTHVVGVSLAVLAGIVGVWTTTQWRATERQVKLETQKEKVSYAVGMQLAKATGRLGVDLDPRIVEAAARDVLEGRPLAMTDKEVDQAISSLQGQLEDKQAVSSKEKAERAKKDAEAFLLENAKKQGVVTLPSGLQYKVLEAGNGPTPSLADTVECNYRGTLVDGTEFDSSQRRSTPTVFKIEKVIQGWREALTRMPAGSRWQLVVPPQ